MFEIRWWAVEGQLLVVERGKGWQIDRWCVVVVVHSTIVIVVVVMVALIIIGTIFVTLFIRAWVTDVTFLTVALANLSILVTLLVRHDMRGGMAV